MGHIYCNVVFCKYCDIEEWECCKDEIHLRTIVTSDEVHSLECTDFEMRKVPQWKGEDEE